VDDLVMLKRSLIAALVFVAPVQVKAAYNQTPSDVILQSQLGPGVWSALQNAVGSVGSFVVNGGTANVGINTTNPMYPLSIGAGTWQPTSFITVGNSNFVSTTGSAPSANPDPIVALQKLSSYSSAANHNPTLLVAARKETTVSGANISALDVEAFDDVGGNGSFTEGARVMSQSANGLTSQPEVEAVVAAALAGGPGAQASNYSYLVSVEGEVDNFYADAPPPDQFINTKFAVSFLADSLVSGTKLADAGFMCNPFNPAKFQSCFFAPATGVNTAAFATALPMQSGWTLDTAGASTPVASGASLSIAPGAGVLFVHENAANSIGVIMISAGVVAILGQSGSIFVVSCSPPVGKIGACWVSGQPYKLINNTSGGVTFNITSDRLNPT
jgi:hypothetical protein